MVMMVSRGKLVTLGGTKSQQSSQRAQSEHTTSIDETSALLPTFSTVVPSQVVETLEGRV